MTVDEIKSVYSMRDIVARYGMQPSRAGFIPCLFHQGDRTPSLKIYDKDFHCHACGENGDIFTFVQKMENVSFKEAYLILGGTYEKPSFASKLAIYQSKKQREMRQKSQERHKDKKQLNNNLIAVYRSHMDRSEPFSEVWCDCCNALQYQLYIHTELNKMEAGW